MYDSICRQFESLGVRVRIHPPVVERSWLTGPQVLPIRLNVLRDRRGEYFDIGIDGRRIALQVLDVRKDSRHLLLMSRRLESGVKEKFLCGHDERAWFVAAVPDGPVSSVQTAMEALKPGAVRLEQNRLGVRFGHRQRRRTAAYVRQGEWFFVPAPKLAVREFLVVRNEPIRRGAGKPHIVENVYRTSGEMVYVGPGYPNGLTEREYRALIMSQPKARSWRWRMMQRGAEVFARGGVRHADHATVYLHGWHRVLMNTETLAPSMRHVAFLD